MFNVAFPNDVVSNTYHITTDEMQILSSINIEEEISRARRGITDVAISEEIK